MTAKRTSTQPRLLVVDDDPQYGKWLSYHLGVFCPDSSVSALSLTDFDRWCEADSGHECDIVLVTACCGSSPEDPKAKGLELLRRLRGRTIFPAVILVAEEGNELTAVRALQLGAVDYLPKRLLTPERLNTSVRLAIRRIEKRVQRKLANAPNVTGVTLPPEEETTREQPKMHRAVETEAAQSQGPSKVARSVDPALATLGNAQASQSPGLPRAAASTDAAPPQTNGQSKRSAEPVVTQAAGAASLASSSPANTDAVSAQSKTTAELMEAVQAASAASSIAASLLADIKAGSTFPGDHTYTATGVDFRSDEEAASGEELVAALLRAGEEKPVAAEKSERSAIEKPVVERLVLEKLAADKAAAVEKAEPVRPLIRTPITPPAGTTAAPPAARPTAVASSSAPAASAAPAAAVASSPAPTASVASTASTAQESSTAATQLMAPGLLAAALDAAAASAMAVGIKPTDSSVFSSTATGVGRGKSSSNGSSKRNNSASPAVTAEFIPGYIIKMKIGESEKAVVYLATSISLGCNVALKVSKTLRDDIAGKQFLEREYTAIIAIRDPLVVQIYDYGVHAGFEYLAMEYLLRGDLKARMQAGLKEIEALRYVAQIAAALSVVHNAGLLHRDLKPPNVMLRENDDVALIDFGLARALDGSTPSTRTGVLRGSPYYMSPEQAQGEQLDVRSDFYSLGIIFYEMLTGRKPFTGATAMEVLQQHVNSPLPPLPHSLSRYDAFLHKLVAKNRAERFASAEEILAAIAELRTAMTLNVESAVA